MKYTRKVFVRVVSLMLSVIMLFGVFPTTAMASNGIDAPLNGVTGSGWDDFGGSPDGYEDDSNAVTPDVSWPDSEEPSPGEDVSDPEDNNIENLNDIDDVQEESETEVGTEASEAEKNAAATPTQVPLGASGIVIDLPPDVLADLIAFMENAEDAISSGGSMIMPFAGVGDTGTITWSWGESAGFNAGGYYVNNIPSISLSTTKPSEGRPFCAQFGPDPLMGGKYTAAAFSNNTILKLMIAYNDGKASAVGTQLAIWSITNAAAFATHPDAKAALSAASSVSTEGYTLLRWTTGGSYQPFFTVEKETIPPTEWTLKILKQCSETGKLLKDAEFSVTGPGVNITELKTDNKGQILVDIPAPGGTYTVTETTPPPGYFPADPASQTVTINSTNPTGTVTFKNEPDDPPDEEEGESSFRVEVEVEVVTDVQVRNEKEIEYSRAYGQFTIRKHDQDGNSLDGALFDIEVKFTDGTVLRETNWEVDNGARLFTYTHPENNHDPATITVWEVVPPQHYTGDPTPQTVTVQPSYVRTIISMSWTETIWTYYYHYTVIEIKPDGEEVTVETYDETREEFEVTAPIIESFPEHVPGDREITTTFTNVRERGQLIVTKRDANTGQALAGAQVHVKGVDLGNAGTYDRTLTTGADGRAVFDGLFPGSYSIQEIQPPFGYNLDDQVQAVTIQSNETVYREIHNARKAGLFIKKVDQNGQPIAGATFELRRGSGEVLMREVTDQNGIIYRGYLTTDTYIIEEIKAPEGYLLDENNPQTLYIPNDDDNKEFVVTFVNKKKPAIEIEKVDGTTPTLKLEGGIFRITDTRTGNYWDIKTGKDGKALLENLEINTTYIVEEIEAPEGYVNSGYRQEIVLKESRGHTLTISNEQKPSLKIIKKDAVSGGFLAGATFRLAKEGGNSFQDVTTDKYGEVMITDLAPGTYILTEVKAPSGYIINSAPQTVIIKQGEHTVVEITNYRKSTMTLIKKDALTGKTLPGAVFRFAKDGGSDYQEISTGSDGVVRLDDIVPGTYILTEIKAPNGYLISNEPMTVIIANGEDKVIELVNYKQPSLEILKKDKMTGELLADATFRVSWNNGADFRDVTTDKSGKATLTGLNDGWYTVVEVRAPEGYLLNEKPEQVLLKPGEAGVIEIFNEAKPSLTILKIDNVTKTPLQYAKFRIERKTDDSTILVGEYVSDENGIVFLDNIMPGRYLITEVEAPDGFNIDKEIHEVTIEYGKPYKLQITNTAKSPIYIQKVDDKGAPLIGAKFRISTMNGSLVGTVTSGLNGYAILPYVSPGWYIVEEVQAPDGYILSSTPVNVEVKSGQPAQVEFVNYKKPELRILKLDKSDNTALMGARIKVAKTNGEIIGTYTSDADGLVILSGLEAGSYTITEVAAPDGFILDATPQIVELKKGETKQIELYNVSMPGLQLQKIDKLTNQPVKDAVFNLVRLDNGGRVDLGTHKTGENGLFFIPDLLPGNHVLTEVTAPAGYILDPTPQNIYIEAGKLNTISVYNMPYSSLRVLKIDAETRAPLENAVFKLYNEKRLEIGTYTTTALGEILIPELPAGTYFLQETKAPAGYILDSTVQKIELIGGQTTVVEVKNKELGSLRIIKRNKEDGKPLYGATFLLYDAKNNMLGEFVSDQNGLITFGKNLAAGTYKIKEIKAPDGFVLDETIRTVTVKEGETTEIVIENVPKTGRIQITKVASAYNEITKDKEGAGLKGAVFEIYNNKMELVDTIETEGSSGVATSKQLPLGVYGIKETESPKYYFSDGEMFYAEVKVHDDLIKFKVKNEPVELEVTGEKRGVAETKGGESIVYTISNVANESNVPLEEFYIRDQLPTEAVRLETIWTGVWSERAKLEVQIKTNLKTSYRTIQKNLLSTNNNEIDCSRSALKLSENEYVTEFRIVFLDEVQPGFHSTDDVKVQVKVLDTVKDGQKFVNKLDVGGRYEKEYVYITDGWTTVTYNKPKGDLPKTGW